MSSEWHRITFGEFISLQRGHDLPEQEREDGNVPILGSFGVTGWHSTAKAKGPGLTIGRSGASFGVATYTDKDYFPLNTTLYVTDFNGNHPRFAYYFAKDFDFSAFNSGSAQPSLNRNFINPVKVSIPPIAEQKAIAHILGTLDDKIELNRKTNETLEATARALFQSWFVDFDPVRAKAAGRSTGLPDAISDLFPDSFEESELGEIPRGWDVGCLSDCCEITMGQSPPGDTYNEEGVGLPFYQGKTDFGFRFPGRRIYCTSSTRQASEGATLISVRAPVGSANVAKELCAIGRGIAALKSRQDAKSFVYYLIGTLQNIFESYNSEGTVFGAINGKNLASIMVTVPEVKVISAFNAKCSSVDEMIKKNTEEAEVLASIRDTLLPKLISGELRIPEAEKLLEQAGV